MLALFGSRAPASVIFFSVVFVHSSDSTANVLAVGLESAAQFPVSLLSPVGVYFIIRGDTCGERLATWLCVSGPFTCKYIVHKKPFLTLSLRYSTGLNFPVGSFRFIRMAAT